MKKDSRLRENSRKHERERAGCTDYPSRRQADGAGRPALCAGPFCGVGAAGLQLPPAPRGVLHGLHGDRMGRGASLARCPWAEHPMQAQRRWRS